MTATRRSALRQIASGALGCACCATLARPAAAAGDAPWSYEGANGPGAWGGLADRFQVCSTGAAQSPIDLVAPIAAEIPAPVLDWKDATGIVVNNGHTIQVNLADAGGLSLNGTRFELLQFHFHHPSEHLIDGRSEAMEVHFVHASALGDLTVVGAMIRLGAENPAFTPIWDAMPDHAGQEIDGVAVSPAAFLPSDPAQFRYAGSLTTPPCTEIVNWIAYKAPIEASEAQVAAFAKLFPMNARPVQPLHRRFLLLGNG